LTVAVGADDIREAGQTSTRTVCNVGFLDVRAVDHASSTTIQTSLSTVPNYCTLRHFTGKLWLLRRESDTNIYRLIYCFHSNRRIVFLHGFQKKTQKTPRREIEIAERRLASFLEQPEGQRR